MNESKEKVEIMNNEEELMAKRRQNLIKVYDVINKIARAHKARGEDVSSWFYTKEQFEELKKDPKNIFL